MKQFEKILEERDRATDVFKKCVNRLQLVVSKLREAKSVEEGRANYHCVAMHESNGNIVYLDGQVQKTQEQIAKIEALGL